MKINQNPAYLGKLSDVTGATVSIQLEDETASGIVFIGGHGYKIGQIGSFVRVPIGLTDLFGIVTKVGASAIPEPLLKLESDPSKYGRRWMTVELIGESTKAGSFERGISQYPTIDDQAYLVTEENLAQIYGLADKSNVQVGYVASSSSIPAKLDINKLVTRHCAVIGSTGSGKSTTVTTLLGAVTDAKYPSARVLVIDMHGEYLAAFRGRANIFSINPKGEDEESLYIPYWAMNSEELMAVTFSQLDEAKLGPVLEQVVIMKKEAHDKTRFTGVTEENLTADSPIPFSIHELWFYLHKCENGRYDQNEDEIQPDKTLAYVLDDSNNPVQKGNPFRVIPPTLRPIKTDKPKVMHSKKGIGISKQVGNLASKLRDQRFDFLFGGPWVPQENGTIEKDIDDLLKGWIGGDKPITILDLSGVPDIIIDDVVGALLRIVYDALFWARELPEGGRKRPLLIVLEEAHRYLSKDKAKLASASVRRIVKEGRKYGVGAMIVSQRPSEIDPTILSQCGTTIAMRLSNSKDQGIVGSTAADNLAGVLSMLPSLRTGEAIITGEAVRLPLRAMIDLPPEGQRPNSEDPLVVSKDKEMGWNKESPKERNYKDVVETWRSKNPRHTN